MLAQQATVSAEAIAPLLAHALGRVEERAKLGEFSCTHPLHSYRGRCCERMKEALWTELRRLGFTVKHHPDPDPGHPCNAPYDEVLW